MGRKNYRKQNRQGRKRKREQRSPSVLSQTTQPLKSGGTLVTTRYSDGTSSSMTTYDTGKKISKPVGNTTGSTTPSAANGYTWNRAGRACKHWRDEFNLPGDKKVYLSAYADEPWGVNAPKDPAYPDLGFYLDDSWARSGLLVTPGMALPFDNVRSRHAVQVVSFPWADHDIPKSIREFAKAVDWLADRIDAGLMVDVGCFGAHGRTGTMAACLLVRYDVRPAAAIMMVRKNHCDLAIETDEQEDWVYMYSNLLAGKRNLREGIPVRTYGGYASSPTGPTASNGYYDDTAEGASWSRRGGDDEEYEQWLRLNTMAAYLHGDQTPIGDDDELLEQKLHAYSTDADLINQMSEDWPEYADYLKSVEREELDAWCIDGPCALAEGCDVDEGMCWRATARAAVMREGLEDEFGRRVAGD